MAYFLSPKVIYGGGSLKRLAGELDGNGGKAVLITDKNLAPLSTLVAESLRGCGYDVRVWDGANAEPSTDLAQAASRVLLEFEPQLIIGCGGGSVIDAAKAAWVLYENPDMPADGLLSINPKSQLNLRRKARFVAVPTTSGTGSDVTWAIVISDVSSHRKVGFANNDIVPDITVLEPEFTLNLPPALTAATGMDVLGHALDGYTSRQQNDFSDGLCLQAMKLVFDWLPEAYRDGSNITARGKMQNAATIAGLGFGNSNTALCHALAHAIGAVFNLSHGRAVGIALPYSLEYIISNSQAPKIASPVERLSTASRLVGIDSSSDEDAARKFIQKIQALQKEINEPASLKQTGISQRQLEENLDNLETLAAKDVNMYSSPCECQGDKLRQLMRRIWEGG